MDGLTTKQTFVDDLTDELFLKHYGTPRHSGRYPWGSGDNPFQHEDFYKAVERCRQAGLTPEEIREEFYLSTDMFEKSGLTDKEIYTRYNMSSTDYRALKQISKNEHKAAVAIQAKEYASMVDENGKRLYSNVEIGKMLGYPDTTIGNMLKEDYGDKTSKTQKLIDDLKSMVDENNYIDVGPGSEYILGCSDTRLRNAVRILSKSGEDYKLYPVNVRQVGTGMMTKVMVLAPPGTPYSEVLDNKDRIKLPTGSAELYPPDAGVNTDKLNKYALKDPVSISSDRVMVKYAEEGGLEKDGVIELRRGVDDIALGNANYMQVRIGVDGTHYLKGMAVYADDLPEGIDVRFNTNKHVGTPMMGSKDNTVLKTMKEEDEDNPFGATIKQMDYIDSLTGERKQSAINIVNSAGDWGGGTDDGEGEEKNGWARTVSAQMLGKQPADTVKKQLDLTYADKVAEYDEIISVENPVVKKKLLEAFADNCDTAAVHLKASPFPRQSWNVILPVESMSDKEIYAPQYKNGETVVLIRYPHGGTFEIPQLRVNNENPEAKRTIGNAIDAVGINAKTAAKLSGADFDGDTVLCIPCNSSSSNVRIKTSQSLEGLKDFDPKERYKGYEGMDVMSDQLKQREMGIVSNLITDMTLKGATEDELAAAVRHSMVVIDAPKHKLDYKQSYEDNHIEDLKKKYQKHDVDEEGKKPYGGASTLLSRAKSEARVDARKEGEVRVDPVTGKKKLYYIDPETGKKLYTKTNELKRKLLTKKVYVTDENGEFVRDKKGKKVFIEEPILDEKGKKQYVLTDKKVQEISTKMAETDDARTLLSGGGYVIEEIYADYANKVKGLANEARKMYLNTPPLKKNEEAKEKYKNEVASLDSKLLVALKNAPKERQAQILGNIILQEKMDANPYMEKDDLKKIKAQVINGARATVGAKKILIGSKAMPITQKEWDAVNAGAISDHKCSLIVDNADLDVLKRLSMPKSNGNALSAARISKIHAMNNSGYSIEQIAKSMGVSVSTVSKYLK